MLRGRPTGFALFWQLVELGVPCEVVAPTLVPMKAGERIKTKVASSERRVTAVT